MAASALTEKINKIRQLNEEIKRRHEEVEEDKKNAAKQNALVQMVPSTDWPERKEPPEFMNSPKTKQKPTKERHEYIPQSHSGEGRKVHSFAQGEGPPPDPKYNFLADSEREEPIEYAKETIGNRSSNRGSRGSFRRKTGGRENVEKDNKMNKGSYKDESQSGYDAWRAERNRIDEDRISRQRTAEGNWLREWDNDKFISHSRNDEFERDLIREHASAQYYSDRPENPRFSRIKKKYKDSGRRYDNNNEHVNYNQTANHRPYRGAAKAVQGNYDNRSHTAYNQHRNNVPTSAKTSESPNSEERTVIATDKSIKVTVNQSSVTKGPVMSIKVNSPSIAGTGRVGPRQRTRVTYSHSDADTTENESFFRQKSFEDKSKGTFFNNNQKFSNIKRSYSQRTKNSDSRPLHYQRKDGRKEESDTNFQKYHEAEFRSYPQKDQQKSYATKSPKPMRGNTKIIKHESSNANVSQKFVAQEDSATDETNVEYNIERNVKAENSELLQVSESDHTEISTTKTSEINIVNKAENDVISEKGSEETSAGLSSATGSPEHVGNESKKIDSDTENKDLEEVANNLTQDLSDDNDNSSTNRIHFDNENKGLEEVANNLTEDLPKDNDSSSMNKIDSDNQMKDVEEVVNESEMKDTSYETNNAQSKDVLQLCLNATNEVSDNVAKLLEIPPANNDQQSSEQVVEQLENAYSKGTEDQVTAEQTVEVTTDNSVFSSEANAQSVIEVNDQLICNNEAVQHQEERTNEINELSDKISKDITSCSQTNPEDTLSYMNTGINSTEKEEEKGEEIINEKVEDAGGL